MFTFWFNSFVYNQIWEDPRVDLEALEVTPDSHILTISSGGCNVLNYLVSNPAKITAVDLNRSHLSLLRLKLCALKHLPDYEDFFLFFGCADDARNRTNYYTYLSEHLDPETREFWEGGGLLRRMFAGPRIKYFAKNFYDYAKLGYFLRFAHVILRMGHRNPLRILSASSHEEQRRIYEEDIDPIFDHWLVRAGGRLPVALYSLGIPPQQYRAMEQETPGAGMIGTLRERVRRLACDFPIDDNYFCWQAFGRSYNVACAASMPDYLKAENYHALRDNLDRVQTEVATLEGWFQRQPERSVDRVVLLDSQDWMRPAAIAKLWDEIARAARPGARIIFRTAGAISPLDTALSPALLARFEYHREQSRALFARDRSAIYGGFHLYSLRD